MLYPLTSIKFLFPDKFAVQKLWTYLWLSVTGWFPVIFLLGTRLFNYWPPLFKKFHHIKSLVFVASQNHSALYLCMRHPLLLLHQSGVSRWNATSWRYGHRSVTSCVRDGDWVASPRDTNTYFPFYFPIDHTNFIVSVRRTSIHNLFRLCRSN